MAAPVAIERRAPIDVPPAADTSAPRGQAGELPQQRQVRARRLREHPQHECRGVIGDRDLDLRQLLADRELARGAAPSAADQLARRGGEDRADSESAT